MQSLGTVDLHIAQHILHAHQNDQPVNENWSNLTAQDVAAYPQVVWGDGVSAKVS